MKTTNLKERAIVGRTIHLSSAECLVLANLVNSLTSNMEEFGEMNEDVRCKRTDLINLSTVVAKITSHDIMCLEEVEKELFTPGEENKIATPITSTVEANASIDDIIENS